MKKDLLEWIADTVGCEYVSDLRKHKWFKKASFLVELIPENEYSLSEWNEAIYYIFREAPQPTVKLAKKRLILLLAKS